MTTLRELCNNAFYNRNDIHDDKRAPSAQDQNRRKTAILQKYQHAELTGMIGVDLINKDIKTLTTEQMQWVLACFKALMIHYRYEIDGLERYDLPVMFFNCYQNLIIEYQNRNQATSLDTPLLINYFDSLWLNAWYAPPPEEIFTTTAQIAIVELEMLGDAATHIIDFLEHASPELIDAACQCCGFCCHAMLKGCADGGGDADCFKVVLGLVAAIVMAIGAAAKFLAHQVAANAHYAVPLFKFMSAGICGVILLPRMLATMSDSIRADDKVWRIGIGLLFGGIGAAIGLFIPGGGPLTAAGLAVLGWNTGIWLYEKRMAKKYGEDYNIRAKFALNNDRLERLASALADNPTNVMDARMQLTQVNNLLVQLILEAEKLRSKERSFLSRFSKKAWTIDRDMFNNLDDLPKLNKTPALQVLVLAKAGLKALRQLADHPEDAVSKSKVVKVCKYLETYFTSEEATHDCKDKLLYLFSSELKDTILPQLKAACEPSGRAKLAAVYSLT